MRAAQLCDFFHPVALLGLIDCAEDRFSITGRIWSILNKMGRLWPAILAAQLSAQTVDSSFFESKIRPVLAQNCYACHSSNMKAPMGGLVLDTKAGLRKAAGGRLL